jgi:predicted nucleotidyltransferase
VNVAELLALRPAANEAFLSWTRHHPDESGRALFGSATFGRVLGLLTLHPGRPFSMAQVVYALGGNYDSTYRALHRLVDAGLVERTKHGRELSFALVPGHPLLRELRATALHASTIGPRLRWAQEELGTVAVDAAFVFGSVASLSERPASDVDLFVLGDVSLSQLHGYLVGLSDALGRELIPVCRSKAHVRQRFAEGHSFYRNVWARPRMTVLGSLTAPGPSSSSTRPSPAISTNCAAVPSVMRKSSTR